MREFDRDPLAHPRVDHRPAGRRPDGPAVAPGRSPALDTAAIMQLQRAAGNRGVVQMLTDEAEASPVHDVVGKGGGSPLDAPTRSSMESAFGASFDHVRVHTDDTASRSAESVGANAYTVGSDVVFRSGQYDPGSASGQRTIAHELAHVVQQSQGPVAGTAAPGGIRVSSPSDAYEQAAEHTADAVMSAGSAPAVTPSATPGVQREAVPEEEEEEFVQTSPRDTAATDEEAELPSA
jgi:hypothetical protein